MQRVVAAVSSCRRSVTVADADAAEHLILAILAVSATDAEILQHNLLYEVVFNSNIWYY